MKDGENSSLGEKAKKEKIELILNQAGDSDVKIGLLRAIDPNWSQILNAPQNDSPIKKSVSVEPTIAPKRTASDRTVTRPIKSTGDMTRQKMPIAGKSSQAKLPQKKENLVPEMQPSRKSNLERLIQEAATGITIQLDFGITITRFGKGSTENIDLAEKIRDTGCTYYNSICLEETIDRKWPHFCCLNCRHFKTK